MEPLRGRVNLARQTMRPTKHSMDDSSFDLSSSDDDKEENKTIPHSKQQPYFHNDRTQSRQDESESLDTDDDDDDDDSLPPSMLTIHKRSAVPKKGGRHETVAATKGREIVHMLLQQDGKCLSGNYCPFGTILLKQARDEKKSYIDIAADYQWEHLNRLAKVERKEFSDKGNIAQMSARDKRRIQIKLGRCGVNCNICAPRKTRHSNDTRNPFQETPEILAKWRAQLARDKQQNGAVDISDLNVLFDQQTVEDINPRLARAYLSHLIPTDR